MTSVPASGACTVAAETITEAALLYRQLWSRLEEGDIASFDLLRRDSLVQATLLVYASRALTDGATPPALVEAQRALLDCFVLLAGIEDESDLHVLPLAAPESISAALEHPAARAWLAGASD